MDKRRNKTKKQNGILLSIISIMCIVSVLSAVNQWYFLFGIAIVTELVAIGWIAAARTTTKLNKSNISKTSKTTI